MTKKDPAPGWARIAVLLASLALLAVYALPLWKITLEAPQYPEGLGMLIRVNTIEGLGPNDLNNINNLNHYIGMKRIVPDAIAELHFLPWILAGLVAWGVAAAATGRRWMLCAWFGLLAVGAVAGLADFWRWGYDYGHNLDAENAIIKVPGMTYQPPVIGTKQLLNFTAHSWPASGGWLAIVAGLVGAIACVGPGWLARRRGDAASSGGASAGLLAAVAGLAVAATSCAPVGPQSVTVGEDVCAHCRMTVEDPVYAAQLVTARGKAYRFDAIECLASWVAERDDTDPEIAGAAMWVTDAREPGAWIPVEAALFVHSSDVASPMAMGLLALPAADGAGTNAALEDGAIAAGDLVPADASLLVWHDVLELVRDTDARPVRAGHYLPHGDPGPGAAHAAGTGRTAGADHVHQPAGDEGA